jgi:MFS transporter, ACS family, D-galactonate transporter
MAIGFSVGSVIFVLGHVLVAEVTPAAQRGAMLGMVNAVATLAGPLAPVVMGLTVDVGSNAGTGFRTGFQIVGCLVISGALAALVLMNPEADLARFERRQGATGLAAARPVASA